MNYQIDAKKLNYHHYDNNVLLKVKQLFSALDKIILGKSILDVHIISGDKLKLLERNQFETELRQSQIDIELFNKYQMLYYILIKHKYFCVNPSIESNNTITIFITRSVVKYIENDKDKFVEMLVALPLSGIYNSLIDELWDMYDENVMHYIITHDMFPYIIRSVYDKRKICTYCGKYTNVTFVKCYRCRSTHYCSNWCLYRDQEDHLRRCLKVL